MWASAAERRCRCALLVHASTSGVRIRRGFWQKTLRGSKSGPLAQTEAQGSAVRIHRPAECVLPAPARRRRSRWQSSQRMRASWRPSSCPALASATSAAVSAPRAGAALHAALRHPPMVLAWSGAGPVVPCPNERNRLAHLAFALCPAMLAGHKCNNAMLVHLPAVMFSHICRSASAWA